MKPWTQTAAHVVAALTFLAISSSALPARAWQPGTRGGRGPSVTAHLSGAYVLQESPHAERGAAIVGVAAGAWDLRLRDVGFYYGADATFDPFVGTVSVTADGGLSLVYAELMVGLGWAFGPLWASEEPARAGGVAWHVTLAFPLGAQSVSESRRYAQPSEDVLRLLPFVRTRGIVNVVQSNQVTITVDVGLALLWGHVDRSSGEADEGEVRDEELARRR